MVRPREHGYTIYRRKVDGRWCAQLDLGYSENGKRRRKSFYGATRKEALAKMEKWQEG